MRSDEWGFIIMVCIFVIIGGFVLWMALQAGPMGEIKNITNLAKNENTR